MANLGSNSRELSVLGANADHAFTLPVKRINEGEDVSFFLASKAYSDIMTFVFQLNAAMMPRKLQDEENKSEKVRAWTLQDDDTSNNDNIRNLANLIDNLDKLIEEAPPDKGPRRFGNISFRRWHELVAQRISSLMHSYLPSEIVGSRSTSDVTAREELEVYLLGSFGSSQRLDYGSGHELSFLAFLGCLWKLGLFPASEDGSQERGIVLGVIEPYLRLVRRLILTYTLEPAGSHGVWGLDDHSFLPYIFGSAQYSPAISSPNQIAMEGSLPDAPNPGDVAKESAVQRERPRNMYFSAIGFIYDVKKGPFWEHSPILFDISGVKAGWAKINKASGLGMLKMYNAEVLSKFPVVQHFPFGSLFAWERDPAAQQIQASVHTTSQPQSNAPSSRPQPTLRDPLAEPGMMASRGNPPPASSTAAPWASSRVPLRAPASVPTGPNQPTRAPWTSSTPLPPPGGTTTAPWARRGGNTAPSAGDAVPKTQAPWANKQPPS